MFCNHVEGRAGWLCKAVVIAPPSVQKVSHIQLCAQGWAPLVKTFLIVNSVSKCKMK